MNFEIEAKLRVDSHEPVRETLRALGAECLGRGLEENLIFDRPDGSLRRQGQGLRVRTVSPDDLSQQHATLTLKGPVMPGAFKSREELEVSMGDAGTGITILERLGFVCVLSYQKRRESWRLDDCRVELDEPPLIGRFVEIEGPNEAAIRAVQEKLHLGGARHVAASYVGMLGAYCDQNGIDPHNLRPAPKQQPVP